MRKAAGFGMRQFQRAVKLDENTISLLHDQPIAHGL